ncbi:uncharacterized protein FFB14_11612 [Fusarium fujikuroi]|nr:uncharacterized protein FFB14_11612 [Fusarium fujikuroi]
MGSLCKLVIFENDNESYAETYRAPAVRVPSQDVSLKLARTSQHLEILSASFMADASHFFAVPQIQDSWTWGKLASLALTSNVLTGDADPLDVNRMLQNAAAAAFKMPKLNIMELWNGRKGLSRYGRSSTEIGLELETITNDNDNGNELFVEAKK